MPDKVHFDFGDGETEDSDAGQGGVATAHHNWTTPGSYVIKVTDAQGRKGQTTFKAEGPAEPTLTIPALTLTQGDDDVEHETELVSHQGHSEKCTGRISIADGAALDGKIEMTMPDFFGPGTGDTLVTWAVSGADLVGTYPGGNGFPIVNPLDGKTTNHWSADGDAPPGEYEVTTAVLASGGDELTSATWTLTVEAS